MKVGTPRPGRPTTTPRRGQKATLGIRATADLKRRLLREAERNDRSLSQEAEIRLEQSFRFDNMLGDPVLADLLRSLIGQAHFIEAIAKRQSLPDALTIRSIVLSWLERIVSEQDIAPDDELDRLWNEAEREALRPGETSRPAHDAYEAAVNHRLAVAHAAAQAFSTAKGSET